MTMINQNQQKNQLPKEIEAAFKELKILQHLRQAGIKRNLGFACSYIFQIVFCLLFQHRNWFRMQDSDHKSADFPGKDAVYRFLNCPNFAWQRFLSALSSHVIGKIVPLTTQKKTGVLVVDDSAYARNRSKKVELLARCKDHTNNCYYKGFRMLTLGWSDGHTFIPTDFAMLSSRKACLHGINEAIDKRSVGYKRRLEALQKAPDVIPEMIDRTLKSGVHASHVLMDSWFTHAPLIRAICKRGLAVIGMVKDNNHRYLVNGHALSLKALYKASTTKGFKKSGILSSITTILSNDIPVKIVFVRHRTNKREWLAVLSTDVTLDEEEIIRLYGIRWDIETFFKCTKSILQLGKEFQGRSFDMLISHTTIVFARYIVLNWQHRQQGDDRSLGGLFLAMCDELAELDWVVALSQLLEILTGVTQTANKRVAKFIKCQLSQWIAALPNYIKLYLPISICES
ncbi:MULTISPECIES: transposase [Sporomusa]|uniref:IS4 family transposase n=1 Tax=Sporomusa TaxID=2375 RepID=UPI001CB8864D|nr:transposase [Sporomusa sp. GT1]